MAALRLAPAGAVLLACLVGSTFARAEPQTGDGFLIPTSSDFGGVGLMQTRSARFAPDGTFTLGYSTVDQYGRLPLTFQPLPWLEATFRYTEVRNQLFSDVAAFSGDQSYKDRGADLKFLLSRESSYLPQIAVGFQDDLGTGLFSGEYIVGSKRWYDLDFSFGVGWGYYASGSDIKNPLAQLSSSFASRTQDSRQGGSVNFGSFFSGPNIGLFGGIEWHTPIHGLVLKLEYDPNDYQNEPLTNKFKQASHFNIGLSYQPYTWLEVALGWERGNSLMSHLTLRADFGSEGLPKFDPPPVPLKSREPAPAGEAEAPAAAAPAAPPPPSAAADDFDGQKSDAMFDEIGKFGISVTQVALQDGEAVLHLDARPAVGLERFAAEVGGVAFGALPPNTLKLAFVVGEGAGATRIDLDRRDLQRLETVDALYDRLERLGMAIDGIEYRGDDVRLELSRPAGPAAPYGEVARAVLAGAPAHVHRVVFAAPGDLAGREIAVERVAAERAGRIDALFAGAEPGRPRIQSIETHGDLATVSLQPGSYGTHAAQLQLAHDVADTLGQDLRQVDVLGTGDRPPALLARLYRSGPAERALAVRLPVPMGVLVAEPTAAEKKRIAERVFAALEKEGLEGEALSIERERAVVFVTPRRFRQAGKNVGRAARAVASAMPPQIEQIVVATLIDGLEVSRVTVFRSDLEAIERGHGSPEELWNRATLEGPPGSLSYRGTMSPDAILNPKAYPSLAFRLRPNVRQFIGGPEAFLLYDIYASASARAQLYRGLSVAVDVDRSLYGSFERLRTPSDSQLPHVRSDVQSYLQQGREHATIARLTSEYAFQPFPDWFARVYGGLMEEMFGGVGGEVLYRPFGSRWALGLDVNRVRQRDFDQLFKFQDYRVTTGHGTVYYQLPFWNLLGEARVGQFLAGDRGVQFRLTRRFDSGVSIGAWAAFTDVPAAVFGEGSFDKGFFISVPFDLFLLESSRSVGSFAFRPLTRDGGQVLGTGGRLFGRVEGGTLDALARDWDKFWE